MDFILNVGALELAEAVRYFQGPVDTGTSTATPRPGLPQVIFRRPVGLIKLCMVRVRPGPRAASEVMPIRAKSSSRAPRV